MKKYFCLKTVQHTSSPFLNRSLILPQMGRYRFFAIFNSERVACEQPRVLTRGLKEKIKRTLKEFHTNFQQILLLQSVQLFQSCIFRSILPRVKTRGYSYATTSQSFFSRCPSTWVRYIFKILQVYNQVVIVLFVVKIIV